MSLINCCHGYYIINGTYVTWSRLDQKNALATTRMTFIGFLARGMGIMCYQRGFRILCIHMGAKSSIQPRDEQFEK